jgi:hypothetical protein
MARPGSTAPPWACRPTLHPCVLPRLRYKVHGPGAKLNLGLSGAQRAELDTLTVEQLLQRYREAGGGKRAEVQSQYKGVCWDKDRKKWRAAVHADGKRHNVGYFSEEREAALAYDRAAFAAKCRWVYTGSAGQWATQMARAGREDD